METETAKPQPILEQCLALLPTCKGYVGGWHITAFPGGDYGLCSATSFLVRFNSVSRLHAWLLDRQPSATISFELNRKDAMELVNNFRLSSAAGARAHNAIKKALEE